MGRLILLEGPDGGGKTTLAEQLTGHKEVQYMNNGPYQNSQCAYEAFKAQMLMAPTLVGTFFMDRAHYSERFYAKALGRETMTTGQFMELDEIMIKQRAILIFFLPPYKVARANWAAGVEAEEEMVTKTEVWRHVYEQYDNCQVDPRMNFLRYNYKKPGDFFEQLSRMLIS